VKIMSEQKTWKTPEENFQDNRKRELNPDTLFMVTYVSDPGKVEMKPWGKEGAVGYYLIWNPDDQLQTRIQKWMLAKEFPERESGDILKWEDFKTTKKRDGTVTDYKPIYLEWRLPTPKTDGTTFDGAQFYTDNYDLGMARYGKPKMKQTTLPVEQTTVTNGDFYKDYDEEGLTELLLANTDNYDIANLPADIAAKKAEYGGGIDDRVTLFMICKDNKVKKPKSLNPVKNPTSPISAGVPTGFMDDLHEAVRYMKVLGDAFGKMGMELKEVQNILRDFKDDVIFRLDSMLPDGALIEKKPKKKTKKKAKKKTEEPVEEEPIEG